MPTRKEAERRIDEYYGELEEQGNLSQQDRQQWEASKRLRQTRVAERVMTEDEQSPRRLSNN